MQAARKFCALRKSVYVVNHTNGIIRLDNWKKDMIGSNMMISSNNISREMKTKLEKKSCNSWTLSNKEYSPFFWMHKSMIPNNKNLMVYQIRYPFTVKLISVKNIELHIYNNDDSWCSDNLPTNCTAKWEQFVMLLSCDKKTSQTSI